MHSHRLWMTLLLGFVSSWWVSPTSVQRTNTSEFIYFLKSVIYTAGNKFLVLTNVFSYTTTNWFNVAVVYWCENGAHSTVIQHSPGLSHIRSHTYTHTQLTSTGQCSLTCDNSACFPLKLLQQTPSCSLYLGRFHRDRLYVFLWPLLKREDFFSSFLIWKTWMRIWNQKKKILKLFYVIFRSANLSKISESSVKWFISSHLHLLTDTVRGAVQAVPKPVQSKRSILERNKNWSHHSISS